MLLLGALLMASPPVADAERSFAAAAARDGQWTAFRTYAAPDAILFEPDQMPALRALGGRADPRASIAWHPTHTITSCDGSLAYSAGAWTGSSGRGGGSFGTIWRHDPGGWAWIYDGGHDGTPDPSTTLIAEDASCDGAPAATAAARTPDDDAGPTPIALETLKSSAAPGMIEAADGATPASLRVGAILAAGGSTDRSLLWRINALPGGDKGAHLLRLWSWDGRHYQLAVLDLTGAAPSK
ncbi:MAG: hypothetical protein JOY99_17610 [Sphingomonadaceae bacterium]|nr:hypothetical protein [Sphingomonadaceae bacterium]